MVKIKNDMYRKKRGGTSKLIAVKCVFCENNLLMYQKDGIGKLLRLYVDRIIVSNSQEKCAESSLCCPCCGNIVGVRYIYKPEKRLAYRLIPGSFKTENV